MNNAFFGQKRMHQSFNGWQGLMRFRLVKAKFIGHCFIGKGMEFFQAPQIFAVQSDEAIRPDIRHIKAGRLNVKGGNFIPKNISNGTFYGCIASAMKSEVFFLSNESRDVGQLGKISAKIAEFFGKILAFSSDHLFFMEFCFF